MSTSDAQIRQTDRDSRKTMRRLMRRALSAKRAQKWFNSQVWDRVSWIVLAVASAGMAWQTFVFLFWSGR